MFFTFKNVSVLVNNILQIKITMLWFENTKQTQPVSQQLIFSIKKIFPHILVMLVNAITK